MIGWPRSGSMVPRDTDQTESWTESGRALAV